MSTQSVCPDEQVACRSHHTTSCWEQTTKSSQLGEEGVRGLLVPCRLLRSRCHCPGAWAPRPAAARAGGGRTPLYPMNPLGPRLHCSEAVSAQDLKPPVAGTPSLGRSGQEG